MRIKTPGLILREQNIGESDRLVTVLTREHGLLRAFVRGARGIKSRFLSATQLFSYGEFSIYQGRDSYSIDDAQSVEIFFPLRQEIERLSLAQYFAELTIELAEQEAGAAEFLRLLLNAFHLLCKGEKPLGLIKAAVELRLLCLAGYMPRLLGCETCGAYETGAMYFDLVHGTFYCEDCVRSAKVRTYPLSLGAVTAMRFICLSEPQKIFSFSLPEAGLKELSQAAEGYLLAQTQRGFGTLDFYHTISAT